MPYSPPSHYPFSKRITFSCSYEYPEKIHGITQTLTQLGSISIIYPSTLIESQKYNVPFGWALVEFLPILNDGEPIKNCFSFDMGKIAEIHTSKKNPKVRIMVHLGKEVPTPCIFAFESVHDRDVMQFFLAEQFDIARGVKQMEMNCDNEADLALAVLRSHRPLYDSYIDLVLQRKTMTLKAFFEMSIVKIYVNREVALRKVVTARGSAALKASGELIDEDTEMSDTVERDAIRTVQESTVALMNASHQTGQHQSSQYEALQPPQQHPIPPSNPLSQIHDLLSPLLTLPPHCLSVIHAHTPIYIEASDGVYEINARIALISLAIRKQIVDNINNWIMEMGGTEGSGTDIGDDLQENQIVPVSGSGGANGNTDSSTSLEAIAKATRARPNSSHLYATTPPPPEVLTASVGSVRKSAVERVFEWCSFHAPPHLTYDTTLEDDLHAFCNLPEPRERRIYDSSFVDTDPAELCEMASASYYMDIKPLVDLTCQAIAKVIKGKTPEEVRRTFNITNDFEPEEEAVIEAQAAAYRMGSAPSSMRRKFMNQYKRRKQLQKAKDIQSAKMLAIKNPEKSPFANGVEKSGTTATVAAIAPSKENASLGNQLVEKSVEEVLAYIGVEEDSTSDKKKKKRKNESSNPDDTEDEEEESVNETQTPTSTVGGAAQESSKPEQASSITTTTTTTSFTNDKPSVQELERSDPEKDSVSDTFIDDDIQLLQQLKQSNLYQQQKKVNRKNNKSTYQSNLVDNLDEKIREAMQEKKNKYRDRKYHAKSRERPHAGGRQVAESTSQRQTNTTSATSQQAKETHTPQTVLASNVVTPAGNAPSTSHSSTSSTGSNSQNSTPTPVVVASTSAPTSPPPRETKPAAATAPTVSTPQATENIPPPTIAATQAASSLRESTPSPSIPSQLPPQDMGHAQQQPQMAPPQYIQPSSHDQNMHMMNQMLFSRMQSLEHTIKSNQEIFVKQLLSLTHTINGQKDTIDQMSDRILHLEEQLVHIRHEQATQRRSEHHMDSSHLHQSNTAPGSTNSNSNPFLSFQALTRHGSHSALSPQAGGVSSGETSPATVPGKDPQSLFQLPPYSAHQMTPPNGLFNLPDSGTTRTLGNAGDQQSSASHGWFTTSAATTSSPKLADSGSQIADNTQRGDALRDLDLFQSNVRKQGDTPESSYSLFSF